MNYIHSEIHYTYHQEAFCLLINSGTDKLNHYLIIKELTTLVHDKMPMAKFIKIVDAQDHASSDYVVELFLDGYTNIYLMSKNMKLITLLEYRLGSDNRFILPEEGGQSKKLLTSNSFQILGFEKIDLLRKKLHLISEVVSENNSYYILYPHNLFKEITGEEIAYIKNTPPLLWNQFLHEFKCYFLLPGQIKNEMFTAYNRCGSYVRIAILVKDNTYDVFISNTINIFTLMSKKINNFISNTPNCLYTTALPFKINYGLGKCSIQELKQLEVGDIFLFQQEVEPQNQVSISFKNITYRFILNGQKLIFSGISVP